MIIPLITFSKIWSFFFSGMWSFFFWDVKIWKVIYSIVQFLKNLVIIHLKPRRWILASCNLLFWTKKPILFLNNLLDKIVFSGFSIFEANHLIQTWSNVFFQSSFRSFPCLVFPLKLFLGYSHFTISLLFLFIYCSLSLLINFFCQTA